MRLVYFARVYYTNYVIDKNTRRAPNTRIPQFNQQLTHYMEDWQQGWTAWPQRRPTSAASIIGLNYTKVTKVSKYTWRQKRTLSSWSRPPASRPADCRGFVPVYVIVRVHEAEPAAAYTLQLPRSPTLHLQGVTRAWDWPRSVVVHVCVLVLCLPWVLLQGYYYNLGPPASIMPFDLPGCCRAS